MILDPAGEVKEFLRALYHVRSVVFEEIPGLHGSVPSMRWMYHSKALDKSGSVGGRIDYNMHGIGCWFIDESGALIDVDFDYSVDEKGVEIFDCWRVKRYSESIGSEASPVLKKLLTLAGGLFLLSG
ncbi:DUF6896 domain-containing protein [Haloechinothrix halophila]|uniref:DUF6896 domain-containing protein n=1 Tax=Haloechinothrix halophila TaxID=1069073 RepID=UPI0012F973D9|nr:hypothetical protein [Haloechinothrix halophila]